MSSYVTRPLVALVVLGLAVKENAMARASEAIKKLIGLQAKSARAARRIYKLTRPRGRKNARGDYGTGRGWRLFGMVNMLPWWALLILGIAVLVKWLSL